MKAYVISLARAAERRQHMVSHLTELGLNFEIIDAEDGELLSDADFAVLADGNAVKNAPRWLSNGAIACALSHIKALERFVASGTPVGLILEDDAVLPAQGKAIINDLSEHVGANEVMLLYYASHQTIQLSRSASINTAHGRLMYPMNPDSVLCATAYFVGRDAAIRMIEELTPISLTADSWGEFYKRGCFSSIRLVHPMPVRTMNFRSSIDYVQTGSLGEYVRRVADVGRIRPLKALLNWRRKLRLQQMLGKVQLVDDASPLQAEKS